VFEESADEKECVLPDSSFIPNVCEVDAPSFEEPWFSGTEREDVATGKFVNAVPKSIDVAVSRSERVYAWVMVEEIEDEFELCCSETEFMLVGTLVKVAVEVFVDNTVAWWIDEVVHCENEGSRACTLAARPRRVM